MSELIANRYRVDRPLDVDAAAFQAFDLQLNRTVVVKIWPSQRLTEARLARLFYREATASAGLTHPNIVSVYDVCDGANVGGAKANEGAPYVVMEWVGGADLKAYIATREPLPSEEASDPFERKLDLLIELCRGLDYGHEQGLIHGSLDPENIRVTPLGRPKILNFGIAPVTKRPFAYYGSPEQLEGRSTLDKTSDLFSLGVILYELLLGVHPFRQDSEEATKAKILAAEYRPADVLLPGVANELIEMVKRSLARNPEDRYPDCKALKNDLKALRGRLTQEKEQCRGWLVSLRAALKKDTRSHQPGQARLFDLAVLESADPTVDDYEQLLSSCNELSAVIDRVKHQTQIEKLIDSAEGEAIAGEFESASALLADVLQRDPGNARAESVQAVTRRRKEVRGLLQEAHQAEGSGDVAMACVLALQATQLDPDAWEARAEFERMQASLRQRKEQALASLPPADLQPGESGTRMPGARLFALPRLLAAPRVFSRAVAILGLLLLLGIFWLAFTRPETGPAPVSARNVPVQTKTQPAPQGFVSLDVVPWAKVESIIDLRDGRSLAHEQLESPCTFPLPAGRYAVTVSHPQFGSRLLHLDVKSGTTNKVKLYLVSGSQLEKEIGSGRR